MVDIGGCWQTDRRGSVQSVLELHGVEHRQCSIGPPAGQHSQVSPPEQEPTPIGPHMSNPPSPPFRQQLGSRKSQHWFVIGQQ